MTGLFASTSSWMTRARHHSLLRSMVSKKPAFVGMSKSGVNEYTWAGANLDKVSCIYADNPGHYTEDMPKIAELIKHDVPVFNVCGALDFVLEKKHEGYRERLSSGRRPDDGDREARRATFSRRAAGPDGGGGFYCEQDTVNHFTVINSLVVGLTSISTSLYSSNKPLLCICQAIGPFWPASGTLNYRTSTALLPTRWATAMRAAPSVAFTRISTRLQS